MVEVSARTHYGCHPDQPRVLDAVVTTGRIYVDDINGRTYDAGQPLKVSRLELERNIGRLVEIGSDAHKEMLSKEANRGKAKATQTRTRGKNPFKTAKAEDK